MKHIRAISLFLMGLLMLLLSGPATAQTQAPAAQGQAPAAPAQPSAVIQGLRARTMPTNVGDGFTVVAVGDVILQHAQSMREDPGLHSLMQILKSGNVTFGNMEGSIADLTTFRGYPEGKPEGSFFLYDADVAQDLKAMGFTMVGRANNHTTDWGPEGMRSTDHLLDLAGIVHAGTGEERAEARAPRFQNTPKGRVALVSMASAVNMGVHIPTEADDESAAVGAATPPMGVAPGRPGLNALRVTPYVLITSDQMQTLRGLQATMPKGSAGGAGGNPNELRLFGVRYRVSDHTGYAFDVNPLDMKEIMYNIRDGKEESNFLIASIHCHDPGDWSTEPADFLPVLAHAAIDNGADMFVMHGPHQLRGIEIYKGKPIFYSMGNFINEENQKAPLPADSWESSAMDPQVVTEAEKAEQERFFRGVEQYQSVIAVSKFNHGQLSEIRLYPIFLGGPQDRDSDRGIPHPASPEMAQVILQRLQKLSQPFGTTIEIEQNVGIIHLTAGAGN